MSVERVCVCVLGWGGGSDGGRVQEKGAKMLCCVSTCMYAL